MFGAVNLSLGLKLICSSRDRHVECSVEHAHKS